MTSFSYNVLNVNSLKWVAMNNQDFKARPEVINNNTNEPLFYHYSIKINKCSVNCNNINDTYAKLCVPDVVNGINVEVFNLMPRPYEARHMVCQVKMQIKCKSL